MYSFLIVDTLNEIQLENLDIDLSQKFIDYKIIYANCKNEFLINSKNIEVYNFDKQYSQDELLNRLIPKIDCDNLIVVRKFNNAEELINIASTLKQNNDIVVNKNKTNKFVKFFKNFLSWLISLIFHYKLYDASLSSIGFGKDAVIVMKQVSIPSTLTKVNRWAGMQIVEVEGGTKVKFKNKVLPNICLAILFVIISVTTIVLWAVLPNWFTNYFAKLGALFVIVIALFMLLLNSLKLYIIIKVGKNEEKRANLKEN